MKNVRSLNEFINENSNMDIVLPNVSDIDHTRIIKWINQNLKKQS